MHIDSAMTDYYARKFYVRKAPAIGLPYPLTHKKLERDEK